MRRAILLALSAAAAAAALVLFTVDGPDATQASHGVFNVHVHDDFFHPTGSFVPGPGHATASALCMAASPDPQCDAVIHEGDSINWVSPAPLAANVHTVTECTDSTFTFCGAAVSATNPINDSGMRSPPNPGPSGWPYTVAFNDPGTFYYRCQLHPTVMRGRITVLAGVGGTVEQLVGGEAVRSETAADSGSDWLLVAAAGASAVLVVGMAAGGLAYARRRSRSE